mgnify:FL=1|jgi:hypothetical protein|tara:strand:+ start:318 stop:464 length:147 start_codon:yes stop_codon:yes gene_type:complete
MSKDIEFKVRGQELIAALRWLQVQELRKKYPNDADFGHEVAKLIKKDE